jgi:hypothetical protein
MSVVPLDGFSFNTGEADTVLGSEFPSLNTKVQVHADQS